MKPTVIGLVGPIASGKGYLAEFLTKHGFFYASLSDRVREEVDARGLKRERKILQDVGNDLRQTHGASILAQRTAALVPTDENLVVIEGIRNPMEIDYLKALLGAVIIAVDAPAELRLAFYLERAKRRGEDGVTEADFWRANNRDLGEGEDTSGQQGRACLEMADFRVVNDGTEQFLIEAREFMTERFSLDFEGRMRRGLGEKDGWE